jgi:regulator of protease activity HflC (stomatin/prohibitin superfamily)
MGKYKATLEPGVQLLIPILDRIKYVQSLKGLDHRFVSNKVEVAMEIPSQSAITADNVTLDIDGVLYIQVFDPYKARCSSVLPSLTTVMELRMPIMLFLNLRRRRCVRKLDS